MPPKQSDPQFKLRLPPDLKARIEASARENGRTVSGEILQVLDQYFPPEPSIDEVVDAIDYYVRASASPEAPAYRKGLLDNIRALRERLEKGLDFSHPKNLNVMSPEEVRDAEHHKEVRAKRRQIERASDLGGVTTEDFIEFLRGPAMVWSTGERVRRALEEYREVGPEMALRMLGLDQLVFVNEPEAYRVLGEELKRSVRNYNRRLRREEVQNYRDEAAALGVTDEDFDQMYGKDEDEQ